MNRLTFEIHDGGMFVKESDVKTCTVEDEVMHTGNAIRKLAEYEDLEKQRELIQPHCKESVIDELLSYILKKMHWCPFSDSADIDFEKECVGFRTPGCRKCILKHIEELNKRSEIKMF